MLSDRCPLMIFPASVIYRGKQNPRRERAVDAARNRNESQLLVSAHAYDWYSRYLEIKQTNPPDQLYARVCFLTEKK